ncbi:hypothetical protein DRH27_02710 [Candidatus Falkowbacteria bacterium]|nr:MAG: hypothetical protein DRH27_02710 [Candidatus Falkowbacteria bacterium]
MEDNKSNKNDSKSGFFSGLKKFINISRPDSAPPDNDFKKEKQDITNYEEVFSNEKKKREESNAGPKESETKYTIPEPLIKEKEKPIAAPQTLIKEEEKINQASRKNLIKEHLVSSSKRWKAPKILKTNLIKGEITTFIDWKKNIRTLIVDFALAFFMLGVVYFGLIFWELKAAEQSQALGGEIGDLKLKIAGIEKEVRVVDIFQEKLKYAKLLLDEHIYWNNIFSFLEKNLLPKVIIKGNFSGDLAGEFNFSAQADSFNTIAEQIKLLRLNKDVLEVDITGGTLVAAEDEAGNKETVVDFKLGFTIDPLMFKNNYDK